MRLSRHFSTSSFLILLNSSITVKSFSYKYKYDVENFQPIEYVDFNLLSGTTLKSWMNDAKLLLFWCKNFFPSLMQSKLMKEHSTLILTSIKESIYRRSSRCLSEQVSSLQWRWWTFNRTFTFIKSWWTWNRHWWWWLGW